MNILTIIESLPVIMVEFLRKKTVPKEARSESLWEFSHSPNAYNEGFPNCVDARVIIIQFPASFVTENA